MAECVQKHLESMTDEIAELKRTKLFNDQEINIIVKRRREYEYKINGVTKNLQDLLDAIEYERYVLEQIWNRRNKKQMPDKKKNIDYKIIRRIKSYYEIALLRYSDDYQLSLSYFKFCKQFFHQTATYQIKNLIEKFHFKPEVFKIAAAWYVKTSKKDALNIIHRGLALHPDSKSLYVDAIGLELAREQQANEEQRLWTYIEGVLKNIKDLNFVLDILELLENHSRTIGVQNMFIDKLFEKYNDEEVIWHTVAQRELNGFPYKVSSDDIKKSTRHKIARCIATYKEGISKLSPPKRPLLWKHYLDTLIDLQKQDTNVANIFKSASLKEALEDAQKAKILLDEKHFSAWVEVCGENEAKVLSVLEEGTKELPKSALLWELYLKFYILKDKVKDADDVFEKAIKALGAKAEPVWDMIISYHLLRCKDSSVEALYLRAVNESQPEEISRAFKPQYLTWLLLQKGIKETRQAYARMASRPPFCKELHEEMIRIESMECHEQSLEDWSKCLHLQCQQFGKSDVDLWIQYVRFYLKHYRGFDGNEKIKQIYDEAVRKLPDVMLGDFKEKFNALNNE